MGGPSWFWVDIVPLALSSEGQPCLRSRTVLSLPIFSLGALRCCSQGRKLDPCTSVDRDPFSPFALQLRGHFGAGDFPPTPWFYFDLAHESTDLDRKLQDGQDTGMSLLDLPLAPQHPVWGPAPHWVLDKIFFFNELRKKQAV